MFNSNTKENANFILKNFFKWKCLVGVNDNDDDDDDGDDTDDDDDDDNDDDDDDDSPCLQPGNDGWGGDRLPLAINLSVNWPQKSNP